MMYCITTSKVNYIFINLWAITAQFIMMTGQKEYHLERKVEEILVSC